MKVGRLFTLWAGLAALLVTSHAAPRGAEYATKVAFKKGAPVPFPNFVLTYSGPRRVKAEKYPRGFVVHDFQVTAAAGSQTVSWSAGTGDFGPALFTVAGKRFALELRASDKLGPLRDDQVVVSRGP